MKNCLIICFVHFSILSYSQNRSNVWELSYSTSLLYPNSEMMFYNGNVDTQSVERIMSVYISNTSICNTEGDLLFFTNGLIIGNAEYDTLQNSINFNSGYASSFYEPYGLGISQGVLIIPKPLDDEKYFIFHVTAESFFANDIYDTNPLYLSYSLVDMTLDSGLGGIDIYHKNIHAIDDTLVLGRLSACKHANGRDWWIITHEYYTDIYYKLLITPDSILGPFNQKIGSELGWHDVNGESVFSPDGSKFAMMNASNILDYMEFNRCTGEFLNAQSFKIPDSIGTYGCSFSPNNRFLYASSKYHLYQYDTWSVDMINNVIHIAEWDSFSEQNVPVLFFLHQLAPDGKIYIGPFNGVSTLGVINNPDSLGNSCNFIPHSFVLPQYNNSVPSFPNYDLEALPDGDTCNVVYTMQISVKEKRFECKLLPNPVSDWLNIIYQSNENALFELFDINGRRVSSISLFNYFKNRLINVQNLPSGIYLGVISCKGEKIWSEKVVVQH